MKSRSPARLQTFCVACHPRTQRGQQHAQPSQDDEDFLRLAAQIPIRTEIELFALRDANRALNSLKNDAIRGAAVLKV